ncbi:MAG: decaprenyl-phosphate phosphoribosyltransferase [Fimbriimonadaceae bacterium]|nr:decaprenyl-phosphate phosphoribosyltransferase [Fimbriimonadaceae bacterium]
MKHLLKVMRPKQWAKNLLVFAAIIFAARITDFNAISDTLLAFFAMCLASSGTYIANDIFDAPRDRAHPKKKSRPIAAGLIPVPLAIVYSGVLLISGITLAYMAGRGCAYIVLIYLALQIVYNAKLKHVAIADVFIIAAGFILRAAIGAKAIEAPMSGWMFIVTGVLALTLGFAKRRNEFISQGEDRTQSRESLADYSKSTLDALVLMFASMSCMSYCIYAMESSTAKAHPAIVFTSPMVLYGVARYVQIVFKRDEGGEPADLLFKDPHILSSVILFIAVAIFAISTQTVPILENS